MRISARKAIDAQLTLWPKPIRTMAQTRNHCGEFAESLAALLIDGAERCRTDGTADYCPDLRRAGWGFIECKSVGKNRYAIVYEGRREKDRAFVCDAQAEFPRALWYLFVRHNTRTGGIADVDELRRQWAATVRYAVLLPFPIIDKMLETRPLKILNKGKTRTGGRLGYGNLPKEYGVGRSLNFSALVSECDSLVTVPAVDLCGATVGPLDIYTPQRFAFLFTGATHARSNQPGNEPGRRPNDRVTETR